MNKRTQIETKSNIRNLLKSILKNSWAITTLLSFESWNKIDSNRNDISCSKFILRLLEKAYSKGEIKL